ncbi:MAG TPA: response regulator [Alphaproteobacteria bacterium]|jgi:two-component system KDP operon response regulator KdpE|nr:response regulator [Alphaproteobacteria bacterium]
MNAAPRIVVIEDDAEIRLFLRTSLEGAGYTVATAARGRDGIHQTQEPPALVILDLGLPDMDGVDVIRRLRADGGDVPILILSARSDETQKVRALDLGADDYLTKPFGIAELMARVRAALRRSGGPGGTIEHDGLSIDLDRHRVRRNGDDIHLTPTEFKLLDRLVRARGRVVTHRQLLADVWGADFVEHTHYLRIYMGQLRAKIEADPADPRFILTEMGVGYRFADE